MSHLLENQIRIGPNQIRIGQFRLEEGHLAGGGHGVEFVGPRPGPSQLQKLVVGEEVELVHIDP